MESDPKLFISSGGMMLIGRKSTLAKLALSRSRDAVKRNQGVIFQSAQEVILSFYATVNEIG